MSIAFALSGVRTLTLFVTQLFQFGFVYLNHNRFFSQFLSTVTNHILSRISYLFFSRYNLEYVDRQYIYIALSHVPYFNWILKNAFLIYMILLPKIPQILSMLRIAPVFQQAKDNLLSQFLLNFYNIPPFKVCSHIYKYIKVYAPLFIFGSFYLL